MKFVVYLLDEHEKMYYCRSAIFNIIGYSPYLEDLDVLKFDNYHDAYILLCNIMDELLEDDTPMKQHYIEEIGDNNG